MCPAASHVRPAIGDGKTFNVSTTRNKLLPWTKRPPGLTDEVRIELWPSIFVLILLVWLLVTYA